MSQTQILSLMIISIKPWNLTDIKFETIYFKRFQLIEESFPVTSLKLEHFLKLSEKVLLMSQNKMLSFFTDPEDLKAQRLMMAPQILRKVIST